MIFLLILFDFPILFGANGKTFAFEQCTEKCSIVFWFWLIAFNLNSMTLCNVWWKLTHLLLPFCVSICCCRHAACTCTIAQNSQCILICVAVPCFSPKSACFTCSAVSSCNFKSLFHQTSAQIAPCTAQHLSSSSKASQFAFLCFNCHHPQCQQAPFRQHQEFTWKEHSKLLHLIFFLSANQTAAFHCNAQN